MKSLVSGEGGSTLDEIQNALPGNIVSRILRYWRGLSGDLIPAKEDFDPVEVGADLSHIFLVEQLSDGDYLFRVSGTFIVNGAGFDATMHRMSKCEKMLGKEEIKQIYDQTLALETVRLDFLRIPWRDRDWSPVVRLLLPLRDSSGTARFLIGASEPWSP